jgi:hypothetical protein
VRFAAGGRVCPDAQHRSGRLGLFCVEVQDHLAVIGDVTGGPCGDPGLRVDGSPSWTNRSGVMCGTPPLDSVATLITIDRLMNSRTREASGSIVGHRAQRPVVPCGISALITAAVAALVTVAWGSQTLARPPRHALPEHRGLRAPARRR